MNYPLVRLEMIMHRARLTTEMFVPTKWNSAEDKVKFSNHFLRFVGSELSRSLFTRFLNRLSICLLHIAYKVNPIFGFRANDGFSGKG
jgi:hypothetical protein